MKSSGDFLQRLPVVFTAAVFLFASGCNVFIAKHKVLVDAISAPGAAKPAGSSYRLVAKKSMVNQVPAQVSVIKACIDAALSTKGMYEPPANVAPDLFIEVGYGVDTTPRVDASARETFLQLSARANPDKAIDRGTGAELWDVRVGVRGISGRMETAMPLLCAVAADYMGTDTKLETKIEIPQNAPSIGAVRETAIKTLESKATPKNAGPNDTAAAEGSGPATSAAAAANAAVAPVTTK
jgi:hypothetical protein